MTALLDGARKLVSRGSDVGSRVEGLAAAADAARGRLDDELVDEAEALTRRAGDRLRLSAEHTVVAIAGATGSGKSTTFNALTGLELSAVGVRRPTTSWTTACVWGREGAAELLDWLGIPARHQVTRDSMLDTVPEDASMQGVVLLDLPDHDSTEVSHHLEVDRLVQLADVLVWVLDPQKYADAALHDRYLRPLATHAGVMVMLLNHIDTVPENGREQMLDDVRRLLDADGLSGVPVIAVSAREGTNLDALREEIARRVSSKKAMRTRLEADVRSVGGRMREVSGDARPEGLPKPRLAELEDAFADAAGVPVVVRAVEDSTRIRAARATGWPVTSWLSKLRPDPLKRLHLDLGREGRSLTRAARASVPEATGVQRARVDSAVREVSDAAASGLTRPWQDAVRGASVAHLPDIDDRLDRALGDADLGARLPWWAGAVRVLQWLLILTAIGGAVWLGALAVAAYLRLPEPPTPELEGFAVPTAMLVGGVALGVVLALFCRVLVRFTARARARSADRQLRSGIRETCREMVVVPVEAELAAYEKVRSGLAAALK
jgi:GTPase Era involved in 16S rRNA processing